MGRAGSRLGEAPDVAVVEVDGVGHPYVGAEPAELLHVVDRGAAHLRKAVLLLVDRLAQVGVEAHALVAGQRRRLGHQPGADRERRARRDGHLEHRARRGVVVGVDGLGRGGEDLIQPLDHLVGGQAALGDATVHRPPARVEAEPEVAGRLDLGGEQVAPALGEDVVMVGGRRAARQREPAEPGGRRPLHDLGVHGRPHLVERREPLEQRGVLGDPLGGPLVEVVVGVDQAWGGQAAGAVDAGGAGDVRGGARAERGDAAVLDVDVPPADLGPHDRGDRDVLDEGAHGQTTSAFLAAASRTASRIFS